MEIDELVTLIGKLKGDNLKKVQKAMKVTPESESLTQLEDEDDAVFQKRLDAKQREIKIDAEKLKLIMAQNEALGERRSLQENATKLLEQYNKALEMAVVSTKNLTKEQIEQKRQEVREQLGLTKKQIEELEELKERYEGLGEAGVAALDEMAPKFKDLATKMGVLSPKANRLAGNFSKFAEALKSKDGRKGVVAGFREAFNAKNLFLSLT